MNNGFDIADQMLRGIKKHGGYTLWTNSPKREHGYVVSTNGYELKISIYLPEEMIIDTLRQYIMEHGNEGDCISCWVDEGDIYCDVNDWIPNMQEALHVARQRYQLSIYDLEYAECVYLDDSQIAA